MIRTNEKCPRTVDFFAVTVAGAKAEAEEYKANENVM